MPTILGILESSLYVEDLHRAERFYTEVFDFPRIALDPERHVFFRVGEGLLLLFRAQTTRQGDDLPPHGAEGSGHLAFAIAADTYDDWKSHLQSLNIPIEKEVTWPGGYRSLYFRDPDGNLLELATPEMWGEGKRGA